MKDYYVAVRLIDFCNDSHCVSVKERKMLAALTDNAPNLSSFIQSVLPCV